jgi:hypothetical protein
MGTTNDSVIIGSVLVLVFGALFYYLYSRLQYSEKRVNVMETILLDLKTASETYFTSSADMPSEEHFESSQPEPVVADETFAAVEEENTNTTTTATADTTTSTTTQKVTLNYESMNIKELQAEARTRNISGVSGMRRKELIENLRKSDDGSSATTLDSFVDMAAPVTEESS